MIVVSHLRQCAARHHDILEYAAVHELCADSTRGEVFAASLGHNGLLSVCLFGFWWLADREGG
jgi:hypothetical protein